MITHKHYMRLRKGILWLSNKLQKILNLIGKNNFDQLSHLVHLLNHSFLLCRGY